MRLPVAAASAARAELDHPNLWMLGVIISAMVYGGLLSLTLSYIPLLLKTSDGISRRMRNFLLVYVTIMVAISTTVTIITIVDLMNGMTPGSLQPTATGALPSFQNNGMLEIMLTMLASWGADGFMLWRCAMLYEGVSRPRRIALIAFLVGMTLVSFGSWVAFYVVDLLGPLLFVLITSVTIFLNLVTAILIALRILYFSRYIQKTVGLERNSPYMSILAICIESSALIVVFDLIYIILGLTNVGASLIPIHAMVHIYVISPLLIVYRVAQGKAATVRQRPSDSGPPVSVLYFASEQPPLSSGVHTVENL